VTLVPVDIVTGFWGSGKTTLIVIETSGLAAPDAGSGSIGRAGLSHGCRRGRRGVF
jgi:ABC-type transport system involved in cytochrome c biogenesis ATPase subunit